MKSLPWLRLYTEIIDDEKLGLLAFEDRWHFVALLCLKGKGVLDNEPDAELLARKVALKMGLTCAELEKVAHRLSRMGLIDNETFQPCAWDMRQMQSDTDPTNAQRQHRHRMKNKGVTGGNALRNAEITRTDTDTDTEVDTEKEKEGEKKPSAYAPPLPADLLNDFIQVRKAKKAGALTKTAIAGLQREADKAGISLEAAVTACCEYGWQGFNAQWYADRTSARPVAAMTASNRQAETFAERDARNKREAWERMTGRQWPADELPGAAKAAPMFDVDAIEIKRLTK